MPTRLKRYDLPGHTHFLTFSCYRRLTFFWHDAVKQIAIEGLRLLQSKFTVCLVGYVIMPEHMHIIVYPHARGCHEPVPISRLLHSFKRYVGQHGKQCLAKLRADRGKLWSAPLEDWAATARLPFWTTRGYDFNIDRLETLIEKLHYCHKNPLTRGLVRRAEDWQWSSYRFYEFDDRSVLTMDWNRSWPIEW
jgi:putative transposase